MNGINLKIATGWTAATLAAQRRSWLEVKRLSREIKDHADRSEWDTLFELAEQRDGLISAFFSQSVCKPIFQIIVHELEEIKQEHGKTMQRILVELERNSARESLIKQQRDDISRVLPQ